ncbi:MAG TPA: hypothetical protein VIN08_08490, partial [Ohtaekwangia sp.]|uniref:hypothetical protein n=1 Tax=Ohtaekwangia sp. TaxID=2066019 RepID=UPI002F953A82
IMAVINSAIALYKAIQSFIKYITKMLEIVNSFVEGILEICSGNIKNAANFLERSLADGVPIVIGFLANQVGLDLSGRIRDVLGTVREKVDKGLDFLIDKVVGFVEKLVAKVKQAKDKILGWFGLKKPLTTKDGVNHTLYFTGSENNSVLTIATTPMSVVDYIGKIKTDNKLKDSDVATPLATAQKIDTEEKKDASTDADKQKKTDEVNKLMTQLATELSALPLTAATGVNSGAIYGGEYMGFFGSSAVVAFQKAPFDPGSGPNVSHSIFDKINVRRDLNGSYYVKGHLLNDNLGGPGTTWSNLTPINRQANKDHQLEFEDPVKLIVNGTAAKVTNTKSLPTKGTMKGFSVTASYGRSEPAALSQLKDDSIDDYPSGFDPAWDMTEVIDVLEGEKYVPTQLNCSAVITKENETTEKTHSKTIMNDINYGILSSYQFGAKPKVNVILGEKIKDCKTVTEALAILMEIKGIGYARAQRIIDVFKAKKKITNGKSEIGIGVQALNKQNRDKNITWGAVPASWNPS